MQPPPRGCVLKLHHIVLVQTLIVAAASARLCVETCLLSGIVVGGLQQPPPRGCVLKHSGFF